MSTIPDHPTTEERLRDIMAEQFGSAWTNPADLATVDLDRDCKADSIDLVELIMRAEEHFRIELTDDDVETFVGLTFPLPILLALIDTKLAAKVPA